jgi:hypothetical protein
MKRKMLTEVRLFLNTLVVNSTHSTQHVVQKYALAIVFSPCIHFGADWDEQNHHLLKNHYFQLLPHFHGALHFGMLPRMELSSDAQWFGNLTSALSFWNSPSCFHKLLRKHKISFRGRHNEKMEMRNAHQILVGTRQGKILFQTPMKYKVTGKIVHCLLNPLKLSG